MRLVRRIGRYRGMEVRPKAVPGDFNRHCVGGGGAGNLPAGATYGRRKCALIFLIKELRELEYSLHRQGFSNCLNRAMTYHSATIRLCACGAALWIEGEEFGHCTHWDTTLDDNQRRASFEFNP